VQLSAREFDQTFRQAGRTSLIDVTVPGQAKQSVFVHAVQRHPVRRDIIHVDFLAVDLTHDFTVAVPLHFIGEPEIVKRNEAVVNHLLNTLDIRTLPANVPANIEVDVSGLEGLDQNISAGDIALPENVALITPADTIVVSLTPSRTEQEAEEAVEATEAAAEPELVNETREDEDTDKA
jgi:large subunit ribosomal protein L25